MTRTLGSTDLGRIENEVAAFFVLTFVGTAGIIEAEEVSCILSAHQAKQQRSHYSDPVNQRAAPPGYIH